MSDHDAASRQDILAKMAQSRAEIRRVLEPAPRIHRGAHPRPDGTAGEASSGTFPRSRTMRMLLSGRGIGTAGAMVGGLLMARPALAFKLLRMLPTGAVARMLMVKAVTAWRSRL
jgi:hypothetical protein